MSSSKSNSKSNSTSKFNNFIIAVTGKHVSAVKKILANPENQHFINQRIGSKNDTALHYACSRNRFDVVQVLVEAGADVNCKNDNGFTPFMYAIRTMNSELISYFLNNESLVAPTSDDMIQAVCTLNLDIVKLVHSKCPDVNKLSENNHYLKSPLRAALTYTTTNLDKQNNYEIALYLLKNSASLNIDNDGDTYLFPDWLYTVIQTKDPIYNANVLEILYMFFEKGVDVNKIYNSSHNGSVYGTYTCLHCTLNFEVTHQILKRGFNRLEHKNAREYTPLFWHLEDSLFDVTPELVQLYLTCGADPNTINDEGQTPLQYMLSFELKQNCDEIINIFKNVEKK